MKKRLFSLFMACVMTLSLAITAFAADPIEVTVNLNYSGAPEATTAEADADTHLITVSNPEREGYFFTGWALDAEGEQPIDLGEQEFTVADEIFAQWQEEFELTFDMNEHGEAPEVEVVENVFTMPDNPEDDGDWTFGGWYTDENLENKVTQTAGQSYTLTGNTTFYAQWTKESTGGQGDSEATVLDGTEAMEGTTEFTGAVTTPIIKIIVPADNTVTINPYKLKVTVGDKQVSSQIISATNVIENHSNVPVQVKITITGAIPDSSDAVFATAALKGTETTKSIFMYFEAALAGTYADSKFADPKWATSYTKGDAMIAVGTTAVTLDKLPVIPAGTYTGDACTTPTGLAFRLTGDVASNTAETWTEDDTVNVTIAYTFNVVANTGK